ncbi:STM3941 family protein [Neisseriaceae bacterium B1]
MLQTLDISFARPIQFMFIRYLLLGLFSLWMLLLNIYALFFKQLDNIYIYMAIMFIWVAALLVVVLPIRKKGVAMQLDNVGLRSYQHGFYRLGWVEWQDIIEAKIFMNTGKEMLGLNVKNPDKYLNRLNFLQKYACLTNAKLDMPLLCYPLDKLAISPEALQAEVIKRIDSLK